MFSRTLGAAALVAAAASPAAALTVVEEDFNTWQQHIVSEAGGTASFGAVADGGPAGAGDAYMQITTVTNAFDSVVWAGLTSEETYTAAGGLLTYNFSIQVNPNVNPGGDHHAFGLLLSQSDSLFLFSFGVTGPGAGWRALTASGTLTEANFGTLSGAGALDLSSPFAVGFAVGNSRSGTRGAGWDDFSLSGLEEAAVGTEVPVPPAAALLAGALGLLALRRRG